LTTDSVAPTPLEQERAAEELEATGNFRVLRRLLSRSQYAIDDGSAKKIGIVLDVETTGLDTATDEIIELGMVKFEFATDGRIFRILDRFDELQEPSIPISMEITALTGITAGDVAGKAIDPVAVEAFVEDAAVVIAHNAGFDRKFCERFWPGFVHKGWACSVTQIDWRAEGFEGSRLGYLLSGCGLFHDGHRAQTDCEALLEILSRPLPKSGEPALKRLLDVARRTSARIWAENSPFDMKDVLKGRGYRWNDGSDGRPKAWWHDVPEDERETEFTFLRDEIYLRDVEPNWSRISTFERFSTRG